MEILLVSDELSPYTGDGPVAECVAALSRALCQLGHHVTVAMLAHEGFEQHGVMVARRLTPLALGGGDTATVHDGQLPSGVKLVLFDGAKSASGAAPEGGETEASRRIVLLGRAATAFAEQRSTPFDVLHAHGTASAGAIATTRLPSVFTFYGTRERGEMPLARLSRLPIPDVRRAAFVSGESANLLVGAMLTASAVVALSPALAERALETELAGDAGARLRAAGVEVTSIPAGIDYAVHNPATDAALPFRFDKEGTHGKAACKAAVCREFDLELDAELPLLLLAQPLDAASGAGLILGCLLDVCQAPVQVIVAGEGELDREFAAPRFERLSNYRYIGRAAPELSRRLLAAADFRWCPNPDSLLGTDIRTAQRYGTLPVALGTPVAADAIVDCAPDVSSGTGFLFDEASSEAAMGCTTRAVSAFRLPAFPRLRRRVMGLDVGWERAARRHAQLYKVVASTAHPLDG